MNYLPIKQLEFVPFYCFHYQNFHTKKKSNERITELYEIDLITEGTAQLTIDGIAYFFERGDLCFRKPGQRNRYSWNHLYECDTLHFAVKNPSGEEFNTIFDTFPTFLRPKNFDDMQRTFQKLKSSFFSAVEYDQLTVKMLTLQLLLQLYSAAGEGEPKSFYHPAVRQAIAYIQEHLTEELTMQKIAQHCGLSSSYFQFVFKNATGKTPNQFLTEQRLNLARKKLLSTNIPIGDIAFECGFSSCSYFIHVFKKMYHQTPIQFRQADGNLPNE